MKNLFAFLLLFFAATAIAHSQTADTSGTGTVTVKAAHDSSQVFVVTDVEPLFPGGTSAFNKYIQANVVFPQAEKAAKKQGTVYITFIIERDGSITNMRAVREVAGAPGFTSEAIRVLSAMPKWSPGKISGRTVRTQMTVPIKFAL